MLELEEKFGDLSLNGGTLTQNTMASMDSNEVKSKEAALAGKKPTICPTDLLTTAEQDLPDFFMKNLKSIFFFSAEEILTALNKIETDKLIYLRKELSKTCINQFPKLATMKLIKRQSSSRPKIVWDIYVHGSTLNANTEHKDLTRAYKKDPNFSSHVIAHPNSSSTDTENKDEGQISPNKSQLSQQPQELGKVSPDLNPMVILTRKMNFLIEKTTSIHDGQDKVLSRLTSIEASIDSLDKLCKANEDNLRSLTKRVTTLETSSTAGINDLDKLAKANEKNLKSITVEVTKLKSSDPKTTVETNKIWDKIQEVETATATNTQVENMAEDLTEISTTLASHIEACNNIGSQPAPSSVPFDPEETVVVMRLEKLHNETDISLKSICENLVSFINPTLVPSIVAVRRLGDQNGRSGIVKIQLTSVTEKIALLKGKLSLKSPISPYQAVTLRTSQTHEGRLLDLNFRTLLAHIPQLQNSLQMTSNGKLVPYKPSNLNNHYHGNQQRSTNPYSQSFGNQGTYDQQWPPLPNPQAYSRSTSNNRYQPANLQYPQSHIAGGMPSSNHLPTNSLQTTHNNHQPYATPINNFPVNTAQFQAPPNPNGNQQQHQRFATFQPG